MLRALWAYRGFILSSISNEFVSRFARSKLGGLWAVIHPLLQVAIFALILSNLLAAKLPGIDDKDGYALYLMAGTLGWNLFSEIITRSLTLFIDHANLMKKVRFPKITLPAIVVGSTLFNNVLLLLSILLIFKLLGHTPPNTIIWVPPLMGLMALFATGLGLLLGILLWPILALSLPLLLISLLVFRRASPELVDVL